ncbi:hypothetical protein UFOVP1636_214 [uncultured Caudovirales phage]|uniref:Uncharacterized protein n=1 Tax=uncultured Caudovirales phage TaxID=2100421 RepID=A0A6J5T0Q8_9CAUD|nr:hypothetical protein UFOVP1636_214 [uncultured Caudovirales phage]
MALTRILTDLQDTYTLPAVCDDISNYFNSRSQIFPLMLDEVSINTVTDSRQVQVSINGQILRPYIAERTLPWSVEYDINGDYRVTNGNIIIYNPPDLGDRAMVTIVTLGTYVQRKAAAFSFNLIALGD